MPFTLPFLKIFSNKEFNEINKSIDMTQDKLRDANFRSAVDAYKALGDTNIRVPYFPLPMRLLYDLAEYSDILKLTIYNVTKEIFRNGWDIEEKFSRKCKDCGKEFEHETETCDECNSTNLAKPDMKQKLRAMEFLKHCNENDMDVEKISRMVNKDIEIVDDAYIHCLKEYYWKPDGTLFGWKVKEVLKADPIYMRMISDRTGRPGRTDDGKEVRFCYEHRIGKVYYGTDQERCPDCGKEMFRADFRSETPNGAWIYYSKDEIFHVSKYSPSLIYGFSNIFALYLKITCLMDQDYYIQKYYSKQRPPRGLLFVNTPNMDSLQKAWQWMLDMFRKNPHMIPPIGIETQEGNRGKFVEFIDFMRSLEDMQFVEMRNEYRTMIGSLYGVMPLFQGDTSASGGLNNEGLQITVTNRAISDGQEIWNRDIYPWLMKQLNVTDYVLILKPNEEKDEAAEQDLFGKKINNARSMQQMGYDITLTADSEFEYSPTESAVKDPQTKQMEQQMMMQPPMGGLPQEQPPAEMPGQDQGQLPQTENMGESGTAYGGQPEDISRGNDSKNISQELKKKQEILEKSKVYVGLGQKIPEGAKLQVSPNGKTYYNTEDIHKPTPQQKTPSYFDAAQLTPEQQARQGTCHAHAFKESNTGAEVYQTPEKNHSIAVKNGMVSDSVTGHNYDISLEDYAKKYGGNYNKIDSAQLKEQLDRANKKPITNKDAPVTSSTPGISNTRYDKRRMEEEMEKEIGLYLMQSMEEVAKEAKIDKYLIEKDDKDLQTIKTVVSQSLYSKRFAGMNKSISDKIKSYVVRGLLEKKTPKEMISKIEDLGSTDEFQAENIMRTEMMSLRNAAREFSYKKLDPEGRFKYKWIGPNDKRTTKICKAISDRAGNGVDLEKLKAIIKDEVEKAKERGELPHDYEQRDYNPHFMCRHTFVRSNF